MDIFLITRRPDHFEVSRAILTTIIYLYTLEDIWKLYITLYQEKKLRILLL